MERPQLNRQVLLCLVAADACAAQARGAAGPLPLSPICFFFPFHLHQHSFPVFSISEVDVRPESVELRLSRILEVLGFSGGEREVSAVTRSRRSLN